MKGSSKKDLDKPSGHVRHDSGGRAVWQWAIDSGKHAIDSTSRMLKKLDITNLKFLDYDEVKKQEKEAEEEVLDPERPIPSFGGDRQVDPLGGKQGFNPYDSRAPGGHGATPPKSATPPRPRAPQPARPASKPGLFDKLFGRK